MARSGRLFDCDRGVHRDLRYRGLACTEQSRQSLVTERIPDDRAKTERSRLAQTLRDRPTLLVDVQLLAISLIWLFLVEASARGWYRIHETHLIPRIRWTAAWPESAPGFHEVRIDENVRRTLRYDEGRGVIWHSQTLPPARDNSLGAFNERVIDKFFALLLSLAKR